MCSSRTFHAHFVFESYNLYPCCAVRKLFREMREMADYKCRTKSLLLALLMVTGLMTPPLLQAQTPRPQRVHERSVLQALLPQARAGSAEAQYAVGTLYYFGHGVRQDFGHAAKWFLLAARQNFGAAQNRLGLMYERGEGVAINYTQAARWNRLAANQGVAAAQTRLGILYAQGLGVRHDDVESARWLTFAANQGNIDAEYLLGQDFAHGTGTPRDARSAAYWYLAAASQGQPQAACALGALYESGQGVEKDESSALHWYLAAAEHGSAPAQNRLGQLYQDGKAGLSRSLVVAYALYALATHHSTDKTAAAPWRRNLNALASHLNTSERTQAEMLMQQMADGHIAQSIDRYLQPHAPHT